MQFYRHRRVYCAVLASGFWAMLLSSTALYAADFTIANGGAETNQQTLGNDETGTVQAGGQLNVADTAVDAGANTNVTVINNGTIATTGDTHYAILSSCYGDSALN